MKKIDINVFFGRWGIRSKGCYSIPELRHNLEKHKVESAAVTSTVALVTDTKAGNQWLLEEIPKNKHGLKPAICVNPYWGEGDIKAFFEKDTPLVRLFPALHNYSLQNEKLLAPVLSYFEPQKNPLVLLTAGVTPQFAALAPVVGFNPAINWPEIIAFARGHPKLNIVVTGSAPEYFQVEDFANMLKSNPNLYFETSCWHQAGLLEKICRLGCAHKIMFGSAFGILDMGSAVEKIMFASISENEKKLVFYENAAPFLQT